jgi:hypothetical protein
VKTPESYVLSSCLEYLALKGIFAWRNNSGAVKGPSGHLVRFGQKGSPDILGILPGGRLLCVECKGSGGKLRPEQVDWLSEASLAGACVVVAYGFDDIQRQFLKEGIQ